MHKDDIIKARDIMLEYQKKDEKFQQLLQNYKDNDSSEVIEDKIFKSISPEEIERQKATKLCQRLNSSFACAKAEDDIYVCLGAYYNGMGPNRFESEKAYKSMPKNKKADFLYYINIEDDKKRLSIPISRVKQFENEHIIVHLNKDDKVENNFLFQEERYSKIRVFYLLELIKSNLEENSEQIKNNILIKIKQNMNN